MLGAEDFESEPYTQYGEQTKLNSNNADSVILLIMWLKRCCRLALKLPQEGNQHPIPIQQS